MSKTPVTVVLAYLLVALVLLAGTPLVAVGQSQDGAATIEAFVYAGDGAVATPQERPLLWQSGSHSFDVVVAAGNGGGDYEVCLESKPVEEGTTTGVACQPVTLEAGGQTTVAVGVEPWPANLTGEQEVTAVLRQAGGSGGEVVARQTMTVTVLQKAADLDGDGLSNEREAASGTDFFVADTDGDGLADGLEVDTYETEPGKADTDGDGLTDGVEVNQHQTDPTVADTDGDGLTDELEVETHGTNPNKADTDEDGLGDAAEVNQYQTNPNRADSDADGLGDAAEVETHDTNPTVADTDEDGLEDGPEANVYGTDPAKSDTDGDGLADAAEVNQYQTDPTDADSDGDGLDDGAEVETHGTNPNKADTDGDGLDDGEEVEGATDPLEPDADAAGDGLPSVPREAVGALFVVGAIVLLGLFVLLGRSSGEGPIARLRGLGASGEDGDGGAETASTGEPTGANGPSYDGAAAPIPTNQNRVLELLSQNGGRMLQSDIVESTDWSKSKVSRVLSDMDEEGDITKIDVGKGNLIALPEVAPQSSRSPLDADEE